MDLLQYVKNLPSVPGVYLYKDLNGNIIYVGKAKNLKSRVKSYFSISVDPASKTAALVKNIAQIEYIEVFSEIEALILEAALIKKHLPKYNIKLTDDKSYLYIVIRKVSANYPVVLPARESDLQLKDITFGPFPDTTVVYHILKVIRKVFNYRDCSEIKFNRYKNLNRPCLYGYIGICSAPCVEKISSKDYQLIIKRVKQLLSGDSSLLIKELESQMHTSSKMQNYEAAKEYRDLLRKFDYIRSQKFIATKYIDNPYLVSDILQNSLQELLTNIPVLTDVPEKIECYDISNNQGAYAVGALVTAIGGRISKKDYKKFKIKLKSTPDDFMMMKEVLTRRLKRGLNNEVSWALPDLIVVDGGKGQLSTALEVLESLNCVIPVIGLAKKFETIVFKQNNHFVELVLPRENQGLKLLQSLRDEAHRFGKKYHHELFLKGMLK